MKIQFLKLINNLDTAVYNRPKNQIQNCNFDAAINLQPLKKDSVEISFLGKQNITPKNFDVKKIKNLRCPICSQLMLSQEQIESFVNEVSSKKGQELIDILNQYEDESVFTDEQTPQKRSIYRPIEQQAVTIIKDLAAQYPDKSLYELYQIQRQKSLEKLIPTQTGILAEYEEYALSHVKGEEGKRKEIEALVQEYTDKINGRSEEPFERQKLISAAIRIFSDKKEKEEVNQIVQKLPNSKNSVDAFFVNNSAKIENSQQTAEKLVSRNRATTEHIVPSSKYGKDTLPNYIVDCEYCNSKRQDTDFSKWTEPIPNIQENLQNYLDSVQDAIDKGFLNGVTYRKYIEDVIKTINEKSNGQIMLDVPKSKTQKLKSSQIKQRQVKIAQLTKKIEEQEQEKESLGKEISEVENSSQYKDTVEHRKISSQITEGRKKRRKLEIEIKRIQNSRASENTQNPFAQTDNHALSKTQLKRIRSYRNIIEESRRKAQKLSSKKQALESRMLFLDKVQSQIKTLKSQIDLRRKIDADQQKQRNIIAQSTEKTQEKMQLSDIIAVLYNEISYLETQSFDKTDRSKYGQYLHTLDVIGHTNKLIKQEQNRSFPQQLTIEVYEAALFELTRKKENYEQDNSVQYFIKKKELEEKEAQYNKLEAEIAEIEKTRSKMSETISQNIRLLEKTADSDSLNKKYKELKEQEKMLLKIEKIDSMRKRYEKLSGTISYNKKLLENLRKFKNENSSDFENLAAKNENAFK